MQTKNRLTKLLQFKIYLKQNKLKLEKRCRDGANKLKLNLNLRNKLLMPLDLNRAHLSIIKRWPNCISRYHGGQHYSWLKHYQKTTRALPSKNNLFAAAFQSHCRTLAAASLTTAFFAQTNDVEVEQW